MSKHSNNKSRSGFTLIELLIVIGIISILAVAVVVVINPAELLKQARDSTRITDLRAVDSALNIYQVRVQQNPYYGESETVYISIPDTSQTCDNIQGLPGLPSGWSYHCVTEDNIRNIDGTGWIPVDLTRISFGSPIPRLPLDPVNDTEQGLYYAYVTGNSHALASLFESKKELQSTARTQGEFDPERYVIGSDIDLWRDAYGIVGLWSFDEGSGTTAFDRSGWGNDGILVNGPIWRSGGDCKVGGCLEFDGVNDYFRNTSIDQPINPMKSTPLWAG